MVSISDVSAAFTALNAAKEIAQAMIGLRDAEAIRTKVFEIQGKFIEAQSAVFSVNEERTALIRRVEALEKQIADLEEWNVEKQCYQLHEPAPGIFVYASKPEEQGVEPAHELCATCYQRGKKRILQGTRLTKYAGRETRVCHECQASLSYMRTDLPAAPAAHTRSLRNL